MDETEHMPRYTLTLVDSTGAMEPLILMDDDLKSIAAKLEGRVSAKTRGRLPRGTGGISATPKGYRAYVYGQINVYGVTTKSERHKRSYWTRTADGNGIGGRKAPVPYGS